MTGSTLPQSVTTVFHEYCNCCKYLKLEVKEESFTSDYHTWNEYIVSCEHYDACTRAHDIFKTEIVGRMHDKVCKEYLMGDPFKEEEG